MLTKADHLSLLKKAIAANLRARAEHDARRAPTIPELRFLDLNADPDQVDIECIIRDPVLDALRDQLHGIGKRLLELVGSTDRCRKVAEEVASLEGSRGTRIDIIDKCWDGIGRKGDMWVS